MPPPLAATTHGTIDPASTREANHCIAEDLYFLASGLDYQRALRDWAAVSGAPSLPPLAALGVWYSRYYPHPPNTCQCLAANLPPTPTEVQVVPAEVVVLGHHHHPRCLIGMHSSSTWHGVVTANLSATPTEAGVWVALAEAVVCALRRLQHLQRRKQTPFFVLLLLDLPGPLIGKHTQKGAVKLRASSRFGGSNPK